MAKTVGIFCETYGLCPINCGEANIVLLNDTWVQTVEVHDQYILVVESFFGFENETTLIFLFLFFVILFSICLLRFPFRQRLPVLIRTDILVFMKFMKQNVLVSFGSGTAESSCPRISSKVGKDLS